MLVWFGALLPICILPFWYSMSSRTVHHSYHCRVLVIVVVVVAAVIAGVFYSTYPFHQSPFSRFLLSFNSLDGVANQIDAFMPGASGAGVRVAILDSGLSASHDALNHVVELLDFTSDGSPDDKLGHGSFVAAVVGGGSRSCPGLAPEASLHIYRVFTADQTSYTAWFLDALNYALWASVDIVNLSVGGPDHADVPFIDKVLELCSAGIIIVSAVGNDGPLLGTHLNPADLACVIGVGGLTQDGAIASFSARGMTLSELHMHGVGRVKPDLVTLADRVQAASSSGFCRTLSGTSVASPIVAGAVAILLSSLPMTSDLRNPAAMKQALMHAADRLPGVSMFEQGAGRMNVKAAGSFLQSMRPHISASPAAIDFTDCPYFGPYCIQPLYPDAEPVLFNVTLLNSVSVEGRIESVLFTQHDPGVLSARFSYPPLLWPWSGWITVHLSVADNTAQEQIARGTIKVVVRAAANLHQVEIPVTCAVIPAPERAKRVLWDQYHNVQFPAVFAPRDSLNEVVDTLDWHGDHLYTNFLTFFTELRSAGFFVDILNRDLTGFAAERYGILMIVDPERSFQSGEAIKLHNDVSQKGLSLFVIADWFNRAEMRKVRFFDKNTQRWWDPFTGGSNVPALNDLLRPFQIEFSQDVVDGVFRIQGRPVSIHSGSSLKRFPAGSHLLLASSLSVAHRQPEIAVGGVISLGNSRIVAYVDSNAIDDAQSNIATRGDWFIILLLQFAASGVIPDKLRPGLTPPMGEYHADGIHLQPHRSQGSQRHSWFIFSAAAVVILVFIVWLYRFMKRRRSRDHSSSYWIPVSTE